MVASVYLPCDTIRSNLTQSNLACTGLIFVRQTVLKRIAQLVGIVEQLGICVREEGGVALAVKHEG